MEPDPLKVCGDAPETGSGFEAHPPAAYIVIVRKGPTWNRADIESFCALISRRFAGEVWAFGSYRADVVIGRVRLRVVKERPLKDMANRLLVMRHALSWIEQLRAASPSRLAMVSLEPFTGGLLGLYGVKRARGVLICEVNGVYGNRYVLGHARSGLMGRLRTKARQLVGSFVLRHADAVRLLFPGQLDDFSKLSTRVVARQFFDKSDLTAFRTGIEGPLILGVGFPCLVKGFDVLCRAFLRIVDRFPNFKLMLFGFRIPDEVRIRGFEHPQIVALPGLPHITISDLMARCAVFALPSLREGMELVLLEAAAAGKCRVASNVDGIPTVIEDGVDGMLVGADDVGQLAEALERVLGDPDLRRRLGEAARLRVQREFTDDAYLNHYENLVSAALQQSDT